MLKKILCWLLIFQHINVYVLHADPGDIRIIFEQQEDEASRPSQAIVSSRRPVSKPSSVFLRILRENTHGKFSEIFKNNFELDPHLNQRFNSLQKAPISPKDITVTTSLDHKTIHLSSDLKEGKFSLHLSPDGAVILQGMNLLGHLAVNTFGDIQAKQTIKAKALSLSGKNITTYSDLFVDKLSLSGEEEIKNAVEGKLYIGQEAHVRRGRFLNAGRLFGSDKSFFDLHGNDFENKDIKQKKYRNQENPRFSSPYTGKKRRFEFHSGISWVGNFAIKNGGNFLNDSFILPEEGKEAEDLGLFIGARFLRNLPERLIASRNLTIQCLEKLMNEKEPESLINEGEIKGIESLIFDVKGSLKNTHKIKSLGLIKFLVGGNLTNTEGGIIKGERLIFDVQGTVRNQGLFFFPFLFSRLRTIRKLC